MALVKLYRANLSFKKTQKASTHHSHKYSHRHEHNPHTHTHTHTHTKFCLDLWKCLLKKECFELGFEVRESGEILYAGRQWIPDSWSNETERMVANRLETAFYDFQKFLAWGLQGAWSLIRAEKNWKVRWKCTVEVTAGKNCDLVFAA